MKNVAIYVLVDFVDHTIFRVVEIENRGFVGGVPPDQVTEIGQILRGATLLGNQRSAISGAWVVAEDVIHQKVLGSLAGGTAAASNRCEFLQLRE